MRVRNRFILFLRRCSTGLTLARVGVCNDADAGPGDRIPIDQQHECETFRFTNNETHVQWEETRHILVGSVAKGSTDFDH